MAQRSDGRSRDANASTLKRVVDRDDPERTFVTVLSVSIAAATVVGASLVVLLIAAGESASGLMTVLIAGVTIGFVLTVLPVFLTIPIYGLWALRKSRRLRTDSGRNTALHSRLLEPLLLMYRKDSELDRSELLKKRGTVLILMSVTGTLIGINWLLGFPVGEPRPWSG